MGLALAAQLTLARLLVIDEYGYYVYAFAWLTVCAMVVQLGFQTSVIRFVSEYRRNEEWGKIRGVVRRSCQLVLAASIGLAAVGGAGVGLAGDAYAQGQRATLLVATTLLPPLAAVGITQAILKAYKKPGLALFFLRGSVHGITFVLALFVWVLDELESGVHAMSLTAVAAWVTAGVSWWRSKRLIDEEAEGMPQYETGEWIRVSLSLLLVSGMHVLMRQTDTIMIGTLSGASDAGVYYPAARLSELGAVGLLVTNAIAAPLLAETNSNTDKRDLSSVLAITAAISGTATLAATFFFYGFGKFGLGLFGAGFGGGYAALMILMLGQLINGLCGATGMVMSMKGRQNHAAAVFFVSACLNFILNYILIPRFGIEGAALATAVSTAVWNIWFVVVITHIYGVNPSVLAVARLLPAWVARMRHT